jgi:uncharacterized protein
MRLLFILTFLLVNILSFAQKNTSTFVKLLPVPHKPVNDFAGFLTGSQRKTLQSDLNSYLKRTTNAIVIVTLDSLTDPKTKEEYSIEEAALAYFNTWGIGDSIKNNGVLVLVSRNPKRMRIEVGTGLENVLDNSYCQDIIDSCLVPAFKKEYYFSGFKKAITVLENRLDNPPPPPDPKPAFDYSKTTYYTEPEASSSHGFWNGLTTFIGTIIFALIVVFSKLARWGRGGGWYTRDGYSSRSYNRSDSYSYINDNERDLSWSSSGSDDSWSSSSSSDSFSSSSSSSSDSYSGGTSDGGGASGSW